MSVPGTYLAEMVMGEPFSRAFAHIWASLTIPSSQSSTSPPSTAAPRHCGSFLLAVVLNLLGVFDIALDARVFHHALRLPKHGHERHCDSASDSSSDGGESIYFSASRSGAAPSIVHSHTNSRKVKKKKKQLPPLRLTRPPSRQDQ